MIWNTLINWIKEFIWPSGYKLLYEEDEEDVSEFFENEDY